MKTRLIPGACAILLLAMTLASLAAAAAPPQTKILKDLIRLAEASITGYELEEGELSKLARSLSRPATESQGADVDQQLAGRARELSVRELVKCTTEFEAALAAGDRQSALKLFEREFIPLCMDLAVCQAAAAMGATPGP